MANWVMPEIIDEESARDAVHKAGGWAAFVGGLTALLAIISMATSNSIMGIGSSALIDAALFGIVAWRVWNGSRAWAIIGLALYSVEVVFNVIRHPPGIGILTIIVYLALINGVRGTFSLHKYMEINIRQQLAAQAAALPQAAGPAYMPTTLTPPPPPPPTASTPGQ
jgi:hypothetical protein